MGGKPPGVSKIMKMSKNIFSELEGDNWAENASGSVASQATSAYLAKSKFERCDAQQTLHFCAAILLGAHLFEIHRICRPRGSDCFSRFW